MLLVIIVYGWCAGYIRHPILCIKQIIKIASKGKKIQHLVQPTKMVIQELFRKVAFNVISQDCDFIFPLGHSREGQVFSYGTTNSYKKQKQQTKKERIAFFCDDAQCQQ